MKILLLVPHNIGTIGLCSLNLYKSLLSQDGVDVKCVVIYKFSSGYPEFDTCEYFSLGKLSRVDAFFSIFKQIYWLRMIKKYYKPDFTISTLFGCSTINVLSRGRDYKVGIFHSPHTQDKCRGFVFYHVTLFIYRHIYPHLDKLVCVSSEIKRTIIEAFPEISSKKIDVIYNIHDISNILSLSEEVIFNDAELSIFSNPVLLFCGRLDANKAPGRLLEALRKSNASSNIHIVYIGDNTDNNWDVLLDKAQEYGLSDRIHYWGRKQNPYKYFKKAFAVVSTSYSEGLPGVLIEALILNIPVITTNSSRGVWEILSCDSSYQANLKAPFIAKKGIISSNNSFADSTKYEEDIECLSKSIEILVNNRNSFFEGCFEFQGHIDGKSTIEKMLSLNS